MQIHYVGNLHWVCSTINNNGAISLYDSLFHNQTSEELDIQLALLYCHESENLIITAQPFQQQTGVFAIAACIALANGLQPTNLKWRQKTMRSHLINCILSEKITLLPSLPSNTLKTNHPKVFTIELWCLCRLPEFASKYMIGCDRCKKWFHAPCVNLPDVEQTITFTCRMCNIMKM